MEWVRKIVAILWVWLSADPDDKITRTPINQHTNTDIPRPAIANTNTPTSTADDASVESSTELDYYFYQDLTLLTPQTMAAKATSYIDQGALQ